MDRVAVGSFLYNCFYMAAMGFVSSFLPTYATELGADVTTIGPIWTLAFLSSFAMALFWGSVSDRSGQRTPHIMIGTAALSVICMLYTLADNIPQMSAVMILGEILGSSQAFPLFMTFVSELSRVSERGRSMGFFWMGGSVGWALSVSVAGLIVERFGMRSGFYLSAVLYFLSLIVVKTFLSPHAKKVPVERRATFVEAIMDFKRFGSAFVIFWLATVCFFITDSVKVSYVLIFFEQELHLSRALAAVILSLGTWAEIPLLPLLGTLSDRIGRRPLLLLGLFMAFLFNIFMSLSQDQVQATLTMLLWGVVWGAFTSSSSAFVGDVVSERIRAKAMSLYNSALSVASMIGPTTMSLAILKTDFRTAFVAIAIVAIVGFLLVLLGIRSGETKADHSAIRDSDQQI